MLGNSTGIMSSQNPCQNADKKVLDCPTCLAVKSQATQASMILK